MTELPASWCATDVAAISGPLRYGYTASADINADGPKMLRISDIQDGQVQWANVPRCEIERAKLSNYLLSPGDIVFARTGGTVGKSFLIRDVPEDAVFASYLIQVSVEIGIDPRFPYWFFQSLNYWEQISLKKGGLQGNVNAKTLGSIAIPIPPLNEQRRIVEKIEAMFERIDKGVENLRAARTTLALYRQSLLKSAFDGRLTESWRAKNADKLEDPKTLLARIQKERDDRYKAALIDWQTAFTNWRDGGEKGKKPAKPKRPADVISSDAAHTKDLPALPMGWIYIKIGMLCEVVRGGSPRPAGDKRYYDGEIPFLKVADLTRPDGMYLYEHSYTIKEAGLKKTRQVMPDTLLISNSGATLGIPKICKIKATFNDGVAAFLGLSPEENAFHYWFWVRMTRNLRLLNQGAAQPNLNTGILAETQIPICSPAEQTEITCILDARLDAANKMEAEIDAALARADALRQSILKRAFAGDLVPQDSTDETAHTLLARIKAERAKAKKPLRKARCTS